MGQTSTPKARMALRIVIFLHLFLLTIISGSSYAQTKTFANTATVITTVVDGKDNATRDDNTFAAVKSYGGAALGLGRYSGELQLNFAQNVEANRTTYVRIDYDADILNTLLGGNLGSSLASLLGNVVLGDHYFTVGARDLNGNNVAIGSSNGSFSTTNIKLVRDVQGLYYLAITPTVAYRSVFIKDVTNALLLSSPNEIKVYNAFHFSGTGNCDPPIATDFEGTGATLSLLGLGGAGVADIQNAIDGNPATFSKVSLGLIAAFGTISQNVYFNTPSRIGDEFNVRLSVSSALANVGVLSNITVEAYQGNELVSTRTGVGGLLNLDLLGLFNNGQAVTIPFTVPANTTFDRVKVTLTSVLGVSLTQTLNIHEVTRSAPRPTFAAPLSNALNICYNGTAVLGATTAATNQLIWYDVQDGGTALATTAYNETYTTPALTANKIYYVAARQIGCTAESVRVPITVTVNPVINFAATTLVNGTVGTAYNRQLTAATGGTPSYTYTLAAGSTLPDGLSLSSTGALTGTPTAANTYNFSITATDSRGCSVTTPHTLIITGKLTLGDLTLPNGTVGISYSQTVPVATGGTPPYTYSVTNLPPGLVFNTTTMTIEGNPTTVGPYVVTVTVSDQGGNTVSMNYPVVIGNSLALPNATLANGTVGTAYPTQTIPAATGGTPGYTYAVTGGLPPGLAFNATTREITGNPTAAGTYPVTVQVTDGAGTTVSNTYTIRVVEPLILANKTLVDGTAGVAYPGETLPAATGGSGSYTYVATNVPAGLTFNPLTRQISGTPSGAGNYTITVRVTDSDGRTVTTNYALKVNGALTLATATLPNGTVGTPYPSQTLPAVSGGTPNYVYEAINLPAGFTFNPTTRQFSGTPEVGGTHTFAIKVTDAASNTVTTNYQITVNVPAPVVANAVTCAGTSATLTVTNTQPGVTYNWYGASGSTALASNNNGTFTTGNITANTVFYVEAVSGDAVSARVAVNVTTNPAPAAAVIATNNQTVNPNQSTVVRASVAAGNSIRWYDSATGGTLLGTGEELVTGNLAVNTIFYAEAVSAQGCASLTRTPAIVTVITGGGADCTAANAQSSGISSLLCVLCGVSNPGNSVDADKNNYTRITLTVGVDATGFQRLVFPSTGLATDSIRLNLGLPSGLLDLSVLSGITVNIMKNNTVVRTLQLNSSLIYLQLLGGNRFEATFAAGAEFDRVEVRFQAVVAALSSLDIYGAQIVYPNPTVAGNNQTICYNTSATLNATASGNTQIAWYDASGNLLVNTASFTTPNLTATTTYYIQVSRDGCANSVRMPITVNVVPLLNVPTVAAATITACEGSPVTLEVTNPQAGVVYKWYDAETAGNELFTGATYNITNASVSRTYYVEATQQGCSSTGRTSVAVTVNPRPVLPQVQASVSTITAGQTVLITASSTDTNVDFNWYTSATAATPIYTGASFVTPPLTATTTYYVEARSTLTGCASPSRVAITITVNTGTPTPTPCISPIAQTNGVNGVALLAGVSNPGLAIDNDTQTGSTLFLPVGALNAYVYQRFTFPTQGIVGDTVRISINSPGKLLSLGLLNSVQLSTLNAGVAGNDVINLNNTLINLELLSGGTQALLTFVPTKAFDAIEVRLNAGILNALNSVNVNYVQQVVAAPQVAANNVIACINNTVNLSVQNPRADLTYKWYDNLGAELATGANYTTPAINASTSFFVAAISDSGCQSARTLVNVTLRPAPAAPEVVSPNIVTCSGTNVVLQVKNPSADPNIIYRWYDSANNLLTPNGPTYTLTNVTANAIYRVEAFDSNCNPGVPSAKTDIQITIGPAGDSPVVNTTNVSVRSGVRVLLTATSSNANAEIRWYTQLSGGMPVAQGSSFLTPEVTANITYYAEAFDNGGSCTSARTPVVITLITDGGGIVPCLAATTDRGSGLSGVGILGGVFNPGFAHDNLIETASSLVLPVGLANAYVFQRVGFVNASNIGDTVRVRITSPGKLLSLAVLPSISVRTYNGATSNNDAIFANSSLINLELLTDGSAAILTFVPTQQFDAVELRLHSGLVSAFTSVDFNYAQRVSIAPLVNAAVVSSCEGTGAVLSINNPVNGVIYRWYLNNTGAPTEGSTFTTPTNLTPGTYNYYVRAVVNGCETAPTLVVVTILPTPAPPVPLPSNPATVCLGVAATLQVQQVNGVTFNWYNAAGTLVASNTSTYTTPTNLAVGVNDYFVEAVNGNSCANTGGRIKVSVTVGERATAADIQVSGPTTVCASNQVVLTATAPPTLTNPVFKWYADAALTIPIITGPTLTINSLTASTTYYVTVSGDQKCENAPGTAKAVTVTVNPPATSSDLMVPPTIEICGPGSITLTASSLTVRNPIFTWYSNAALTTKIGEGSPLVVPNVTASQTFYVTVKGDDRCESPASQAKSVSVIVKSIAVASDIALTGNKVTCVNSSTVLTATSTTLISNPIFTWYSNSALTNVVFIGNVYTTPPLTANTTYYVTVKGSDKCENLPGSAATITVTVNPLPEAPVVAVAGTNICSNNATTLSVTNVQANTIYEWYNSAVNGTLLHTGETYTTQPLNSNVTIYVRAVGTVGCIGGSARTAVTINVTTRPVSPTVASSTITTCTNGSVVLAVSNPVIGVTYTWYTASTMGTVVGTGATLTLNNVTASASYFVEASVGSCASLARARVDVIVGTPPSPPANVTAATNDVCAGSSTVLTVNNPDPALTYRWYTTATNGTSLHTGTTYTTLPLSTTTTFYVEAVGSGGNCVSATRTSVTVNVISPLPAPVVTVGEITPNSITFNWAAVPGASSYMVSLDNGATWITTSATSYLVSNLAQAQSATIIVRAIGLSPCLTSANSNAVTATTTEPFKDELYIPNTFTPNNDGRNDFFLAYGNNVAKFKMRVYNQWGEFVFESQNLLQGWDGTYRGRSQPTGVYVYYVDVTFNSGTVKTFKGTVTLLR